MWVNGEDPASGSRQVLGVGWGAFPHINRQFRPRRHKRVVTCMNSKSGKGGHGVTGRCEYMALAWEIYQEPLPTPAHPLASKHRQQTEEDHTMNRRQRRQHDRRRHSVAQQINAMLDAADADGKPWAIHGLTDACADCDSVATIHGTPGTG